MKNLSLLVIISCCFFITNLNAQSSNIKEKDAPEKVVKSTSPPPPSESERDTRPTTRSFVPGYALDIEDDLETAKFGGSGTSTYVDFYTSSSPSFMASLELNSVGNLYFGNSFNNADGSLNLRTGGSTRMTLDNMGNVGVGTTLPNMKFHVSGGDVKIQEATPGLFFHNTADDLLGEIHINSSDNLEIEAQLGNIVFQTVDFTRMIINEAGNVGIGTLSVPAGYRLAIDGNMICEEVWVRNSTNWPDYVFKSDYKRLPLKDLEQKIQELGHLPNIPSEVEVAEGYQVSEMQKKLLEKIEELTLYLIEEHHKNEALQNRLNQLEKEMQGLKNK